MTSGTLRTILIVGAAVAAVSVAACKKADSGNTADNSAAAASSDANAAMASANAASNSAMAAGNAANDASATAPMNATNAP
jgi:hypothetical protein